MDLNDYSGFLPLEEFFFRSKRIVPFPFCFKSFLRSLDFYLRKKISFCSLSFTICYLSYDCLMGSGLCLVFINCFCFFSSLHSAATSPSRKVFGLKLALAFTLREVASPVLAWLQTFTRVGEPFEVEPRFFLNWPLYLTRLKFCKF